MNPESLGIFTASYGENYARFLPEWERSIKAMRPPPTEIFVVGDEHARLAWQGTGKFVLAPEYGNPYRQAASYNHVLRFMTATWIMHVGVDDCVLPRLYQHFLPYMRTADVIAVDCAVEREGRRVKTKYQRPTAEKILAPTMGSQVLNSAAAYRREFWQQAPYNEAILAGSDVALWIGFAKLGARFKCTRMIGLRYRVHAGSLWQQRSPENIAAVRAELNELRSGGMTHFVFEDKTFHFAFANTKDHIARMIEKRHTFYELDLLLDLRRRVDTAGGVAIDVGAHVGNHTVFMAKICGLDVTAIEPVPENRVLLKRNCEMNGVVADIVEGAAGAEVGECGLVAAAAGNTGLARTVPGTGTPVLTIDSIVFSDVVRVIKVDVEGSEMGVLEGAVDTITSQHPVVYVEAGDDAAHERVRAYMAVTHDYKEFGRFAITPTYGYAYGDPAKYEDPIRVGIAIMADGRRKKFVDELVAKLDSVPTVVWDERHDRWDTGRRSLLAYKTYPQCTHWLVLQDDAIICDDFHAGVTEAVREHPASPISFYLGKVRPNGPLFTKSVAQAEARRLAWISHSQICWGVALCFPVAMIEPMVTWCNTHHTVMGYDRQLSLYLEHEHLDVYYTVPSLVDHREGEGSPSLIPGRRGLHRVAHNFIGPRTSAKTCRWSTAVLRV